MDAAWTSHPDAILKIAVGSADFMSAYRFGTKTADFIFCQNCGVSLFAFCELDDQTRAVLNTHSLEKPLTGTSGNDLTIKRQTTCFDDETRQQRLARRKKGWIGQVIIE